MNMKFNDKAKAIRFAKELSVKTGKTYKVVPFSVKPPSMIFRGSYSKLYEVVL